MGRRAQWKNTRGGALDRFRLQSALKRERGSDTHALGLLRAENADELLLYSSLHTACVLMASNTVGARRSRPSRVRWAGRGGAGAPVRSRVGPASETAPGWSSTRPAGPRPRRTETPRTAPGWTRAAQSRARAGGTRGPSPLRRRRGRRGSRIGRGRRRKWRLRRRQGGAAGLLPARW